jgi:hypothetical protein
MDEKVDTIKRHIDAEREELGRNLDEIEYRVKSATDLKAHFDKNTGLILGAAAFAGPSALIAKHSRIISGVCLSIGASGTVSFGTAGTVSIDDFFAGDNALVLAAAATTAPVSRSNVKPTVT